MFLSRNIQRLRAFSERAGKCAASCFSTFSTETQDVVIFFFFNTSLQEFCRKTGAPHLKAPCNFDMIPKQSLIDRAKPGLPTAAFFV
jgi:hypothetical protein